MLDPVEQAFVDYLKQGHSRRGAAGKLGFTFPEFEERIKVVPDLKRAVDVAEGLALFNAECRYLDPDNKLTTRNVLTELRARYPDEWNQGAKVRDGSGGGSYGDQPPQKLAPTIPEMFRIGQIEEDTDEPV